MSLTIYNTLSREKEPFAPIDAGHVRMYVCGPTVYDYVHIGNARPVVAFDVLYRLLKRRYPRVTYVRNITDIDDRIMVRAAANNETIEALTTRTGDAYKGDMRRLGALAPDFEPRATEYVGPMIAMIEQLITNGHAYAAEGHVLFSVPSMGDYGRLSRHTRDELVAGARVDVAPYKKDPADFVLWKPSTPQQPGWDSPWGRGRPGWHIECSAMSGEASGRDLRHPRRRPRPHLPAPRERDRAKPQRLRSRHHGDVLDAQRLPEHLGREDEQVARQFLHRARAARPVPGEAIRLLLLRRITVSRSTSRTKACVQAKATFDRWYGALRGKDVRAVNTVPQSVEDALSDDINTPLAISAIHQLGDPAELRAGATRSACCSTTPRRGSAGRQPARPARPTPRSRRRSPPVRPRARQRTSGVRPYPRRAQGQGRDPRGWAEGHDLEARVAWSADLQVRS